MWWMISFTLCSKSGALVWVSLAKLNISDIFAKNMELHNHENTEKIVKVFFFYIFNTNIITRVDVNVEMTVLSVATPKTNYYYSPDSMIPLNNLSFSGHLNILWRFFLNAWLFHLKWLHQCNISGAIQGLFFCFFYSCLIDSCKKCQSRSI